HHRRRRYPTPGLAAAARRRARPATASGPHNLAQRYRRRHARRRDGATTRGSKPGSFGRRRGNDTPRKPGCGKSQLRPLADRRQGQRASWPGHATIALTGALPNSATGSFRHSHRPGSGATLHVDTPETLECSALEPINTSSWALGSVNPISWALGAVNSVEPTQPTGGIVVWRKNLLLTPAQVA